MSATSTYAHSAWEPTTPGCEVCDPAAGPRSPDPAPSTARWGADRARHPVPLTDPRPLPPFPADALPGPVRGMVDAVATATQTDPGMSGTVAVTVLAAATGGRVEVEVRDDWREPTNVYTVKVANPGERKSVVQRVMVDPLRLAEAALTVKTEAARLEAATERDVRLRAAELAKAVAGKAEPSQAAELLAEAVAAAQAAEKVVVPPAPRLLADDVTAEACASLLVEQRGRLAVFSAEGGLFDTIGGRYSRGVPALDVWLKAHAGDPLRVDRKGRPRSTSSAPP